MSLKEMSNKSPLELLREKSCNFLGSFVPLTLLPGELLSDSERQSLMTAASHIEQSDTLLITIVDSLVESFPVIQQEQVLDAGEKPDETDYQYEALLDAFNALIETSRHSTWAMLFNSLATRIQQHLQEFRESTRWFLLRYLCFFIQMHRVYISKTSSHQPPPLPNGQRRNP